MPELVPVVTEKEIEKRVQEIADELSELYKDKNLILIGALKGCFIFMADLARKLKVPATIDFIAASSYGDSDVSSGEVKITKPLSLDIAGKDVLIIEDIVDSGTTLSYLKDYLSSMKPASLRICALIDKPERRKTEIKIDFTGHVVEEGFLVGYGLDYAEQYRHLPAIYHLKF
ncbi:hypoxanthine phosphoribosyltransferase [Desulforegula conservatrix]|uniref:hypoxanthine phosphoribosyltransferase n=1 Tax=Desulforegula conservatrix TaxID=153026 RepID=UPI0004288D95|nr:hypoxanthine phosphoribosyltransferase [Desulforegula conservatrix]